MTHQHTDLQQTSTQEALFCKALKDLQKFPGWYELLLNASIGEREYFVVDTLADLDAGFKLQYLGFVRYSYLFNGFLATPAGHEFLVWLDINEDAK